jgi:uncharacterized protein CbrC (UPF0167 family)
VSETLPTFAYHPDPVDTGSVQSSDATCACCERQRGFIYVGPVFADEDLHDRLCPWCIADGSAAERFDADFADVGAVPDGVDADVIEQITTRTPSFTGWQQEHWMFHCQDGAAFLGRVGSKELKSYPDALESLREEQREFDWSTADIEDYVGSLDKDDEPTAYLFECRHCGAHLAYSDSA